MIEVAVVIVSWAMAFAIGWFARWRWQRKDPENGALLPWQFAIWRVPGITAGPRAGSRRPPPPPPPRWPPELDA